jgi:predicted aspartyl protease
MSIQDAAGIAGIHVNTASKWEAKRRKAKSEIALAEVEIGQVRKKQSQILLYAV